MREILFRGKQLYGDGWAYGDLSSIVQDGRPYIFPADGYDSPDFYEVDPATVGQYTGLTDKNGVKIFEGDIVRSGGFGYPDKHQERTYKVKYSTECARFLTILPNGVFNPTGFQDCEVIGNIHDNPELLEGED